MFRFYVAHKILRYLRNTGGTIVSNESKPMYQPNNVWVNLQEIKSKDWINGIQTYRESALLLKENDDIDLMDNQTHIFDIRLRLTSKGISSLNINKYRIMFWNNAKNIAIIIGAIAGSIIAIVQLINIIRGK